jgi:hypothetical protein
VHLLVLALALPALASGLTLRQRERRAINRYALRIHGRVTNCEVFRPQVSDNAEDLLCAVRLTPHSGVGLLALASRTPNGHVRVVVHWSFGS